MTDTDNENLNCPQCGQDLRLPPDAYQRIAQLEAQVVQLRALLEALRK